MKLLSVTGLLCFCGQHLTFVLGTLVQLPVVTRAYVTLAFLTTAGCALEVHLLFQACHFKPLRATLSGCVMGAR